MFSQQRCFGFLFSALLLTTAGLKAQWSTGLRLVLVAIGSVMLVMSLVAPSWLEKPLRLWLRGGEQLQKISQPVVLGFIYICFFCPLGWLRKLARRSKLQTDFSTLETYWIPISNSTSTEPEQLKRQF